MAGVPLPDGPFALFDDSHSPPPQARSLLLHELDEVITCLKPEDVAAALARIEHVTTAGRWVTIAAEYELGYHLVPKTAAATRPDGTPLLVAMVFRRAEHLSGAMVAAMLAAHEAALDKKDRICGVADLQPLVEEADYLTAIRRILAYIADGDCYQVNYTYPIAFRHFGDPLALYARLRMTQPVPHGAYLRLPGRTVLSLSPELFVERSGSTLVARPMKGTAPRGADPRSDEILREELANSEKNRAENLMIVDLIRNDLGRLARIGGVKVERLFEIEAYRTLWHMTSTVAADAPAKSLAEIFAALFPCGSITGAPKGRAMQIIAELESSPRGLYTGALGYVAPGGDFSFNVPIRTLTLRADGTGSFAVGSGIVADSEPQAELAECRLKTRFVTELAADFQLIETLSMQPFGRVSYPLLASHLQRLAASARYFGFKCDVNDIRAALLSHSRACTRLTPMRTRLLLNKCGDFEIRSTPLEPLGGGAMSWVVWAERRIDSRDLFRRHKTTVRTEFDAEQQAWRDVPQVFDMLFCNERGELSEGARCNVFVSIDGILRTPPLSSGVLDGVMRRQVLSDRSLAVVEQVLDPQHVAQADAIYITNALRPLQRVNLAEAQVARGSRPPRPGRVQSPVSRCSAS